MIVYDVATKVSETDIFPQHNITDLISGITFIVLLQSGEASTVEGNKHTHTQDVSCNNRNMWKRLTYVVIAFCPHSNEMLDCKQMKAEVRTNLLQKR